MSTFFQAGAIAGLLAGVYDGDVNFQSLAEHGDTGLGTFNGVDGEMIAVDGKFYRVDAKGVASVVKPDALTPFSVVTKFQPTENFIVENISDMNEMNKIFDKHLITQNIFYMMRIDGEFSWMKCRSESCQPKPYKSLAESLPPTQKIFEFNNIAGSLVVTKCPEYASGVTMPQYHYHFIDADKKTGGHVFDVKIKKANVKIMSLRQFQMVVPDSKAFDEAQLQLDTKNALMKTE